MPQAEDEAVATATTQEPAVSEIAEPALAGDAQDTASHALPEDEAEPLVVPPENEHVSGEDEQVVTDADTEALADATEVRVAELIDFCQRQGERMGRDPKALAKSIASQLNAAFK